MLGESSRTLGRPPGIDGSTVCSQTSSQHGYSGRSSAEKTTLAEAKGHTCDWMAHSSATKRRLAPAADRRSSRVPTSARETAVHLDDDFVSAAE